MATTTNYGWTTPDDTALVKDGASAIRSLGTSVDTTTKALNPSTTLGDIEYRSSTANTNTRLGIGSTGNVLTVAGGVPTWAAPAGGSPTFIGCLLYKSGNQAVPYNTSTIVSFDTEIADTNAFHDNATNNGRITIPSGKGGKYLIQGYIASQAGNNARSLTLFKNNSSYNIPFNFGASSPGGANMYATWALVLDLAAADYVDTRYEHGDSSGDKNVYGGNATQTVFGCTYLGA